MCVWVGGREREREKEALSFPGQLCPIHEFPGMAFPVKLGEVSFCHLLVTHSTIYLGPGWASHRCGQPRSRLEPGAPVSPARQE